MSFFKRKTWVIRLVLSTLLLVSFSFANANDGKAKARKTISVLLVGGGSSHDFNQWYKNVDVQTLEKGANISVNYIDDVSQILSLLPEADVLFLVNNQPINDASTRNAIFSFVESGKGLILGHAALWYNWRDWPEYNQTLVSGGSRGHDDYGSFDVRFVNTKHPVTKKVPKTLTLKDELYYFKEDASGPGIEVLATANRAGSDDVYPSVFIIKNPTARIVGIALGHDEESHLLPAYKTLLINAVKWVSRK